MYINPSFVTNMCSLQMRFILSLNLPHKDQWFRHRGNLSSLGSLAFLTRVAKTSVFAVLHLTSRVPKIARTAKDLSLVHDLHLWSCHGQTVSVRFFPAPLIKLQTVNRTIRSRPTPRVHQRAAPSFTRLFMVCETLGHRRSKQLVAKSWVVWSHLLLEKSVE